MTERAFRDEIENCANSVMPKDYSTLLQTTRDFFLIACVSAGIYSQSSALVNNFLLSQRSIKQEKQLANLFDEQPEGLVVLKERR